MSIITQADDDDHGFHPAIYLSPKKTLRMIFTGRTEAGMLLAEKLKKYEGQPE